MRPDCPTLLDASTAPLWTTGSILFESERDLWAISANNTTPHLIYSTDDQEGYFNFYIEDEASTILIRSWVRPDEFIYRVFDLASQTELGVPVISPLPLISIGGHTVTWLPVNRARFLVNIERVYGVGETRTFQIIDPITGEIETVTEELKLPGYIFYNDPAYVGVASVDPTNQVVLYTIRSEEENYTFVLVLRHLETGTILWQQENPFWTLWRIPKPYWDKDGSRVLFSSENIDFLPGFGFLSVDSDGERQSLPPQPLPFTDVWHQLNDLSRSPDGRYIYYHMGDFPDPNAIAIGPGIIVDTITLQAGNICEADTSSEFYGGQWISEGLFLYRVKTAEGIMSLRVLDVPNWRAQILTDMVAKRFYDNAYGWTPVELP